MDSMDTLNLAHLPATWTLLSTGLTYDTRTAEGTLELLFDLGLVGQPDDPEEDPADYDGQPEPWCEQCQDQGCGACADPHDNYDGPDDYDDPDGWQVAQDRYDRMVYGD
jgi:hypothetical protein